MSHSTHRTHRGANLFGRNWSRARRQFLEKHPTCALHETRGRTIKSSAILTDPANFWDRSKWIAVCHECLVASKQRAENAAAVPGPEPLEPSDGVAR